MGGGGGGGFFALEGGGGGATFLLFTGMSVAVQLAARERALPWLLAAGLGDLSRL